jgi:hypothetical protein
MIIPTAMTIRENHKETVAYYGQNKNDMVMIRSENEICLINSSQYSKTTAYNALDFLEDTKVTRVDKYYYSHYSWSIDDELEVILNNLSIDKIYLPYPRNDDEETILKVVKSSIKDSDAEIVLFRDYETIKNGKYKINLLYSAPYGETSVNAFSISKGDTVYTYISSGLLSSDNANEFKKYLPLTDYLILGDHGQKYKSKIYLDQCYEKMKHIVIHSDNIFLKQYNMSFFLEKGCKIITHPNEVVYFE